MLRQTLRLLRIPFSFFLLPVFLFAVSQVAQWNIPRTLLIFFIWHILIYPASNGYNSYMDRDEGPIGGLKSPPPPPPALFKVTLTMDVLAILLSLVISPIFAACILAYILASRAYSYRGLRLKQYPWVGYLTVVIFQGAVVFFATYHGCSQSLTVDVPKMPMLASSLLIGGFYPLTQIYQHLQDKADGVKSISYVLGYRGTFLFCGLVYAIGFGVLGVYFSSIRQFNLLVRIQIYFLPVIIYFITWYIRVRKNEAKADHAHAMRMNWLAASAANAAFGTLLIIGHLE
jgi:1,4-dihydroxy-2-naphthoate octaprenyltransferase